MEQTSLETYGGPGHCTVVHGIQSGIEEATQCFSKEQEDRCGNER